MTKTRGIYRPSDTPVLDWINAHSHYEPGPLDTPCFVWELGCTVDGYGHLQHEGQQQGTHRLAWVARHGQPPPETPYVLHRCDNPPCSADDHLWLGTNDDNMADKAAKGRGVNRAADRRRAQTHCKRGHEFTPENTRIRLDNKYGPRRQCRKCDKIHEAQRSSRRAHRGLRAPINPAV